MNNEKKIAKCVFCGSLPNVIHYDKDMYYVVCSNPECIKHDRFAYLGRTEATAIESWNFINRPMNRTPSPKKKKNDENNNI